MFDLEDGRHVQVEIGTFVLKELPRWVLLGDEATAYVNDFSRSGGIIRLDKHCGNKIRNHHDIRGADTYFCA